jgi:L-seryl-tRNA(Ser) seleniumtransferase
MKRALRVDKIRLAAIEATLRLYRDPDKLVQRLPTIRMMARPKADIEALARRVLPAVAAAIGPRFAVSMTDCASQIGSGALPLETIPSAGIAMCFAGLRGGGRALTSLVAAFRGLAMPVIGRVEDDAFVLDLRCLEDEAAFVGNLARFPREERV